MQVAEHDVLVIGAGGAGLRAAIEASAAGASVGLVTKSLLGKAHTVMAEGGIAAAALANVDGRDDWRTHFADTMRGGQYVNNPDDGRTPRQGGPGPGPGSWRPGGRCSTARTTRRSSSGTSAATGTRGSPTSATGPGSR